ncbi:hypothetical protein [Streptomyces sp. NBC_00690]|uniref:hypothetical protein n=1 Tax=Streptomyces sp. NBC_00690 TaxID=2975808 RepID=UPI002E28D13A|nr:hypothetical protein [Streptomyces sp. NBC_00690]
MNHFAVVLLGVGLVLVFTSLTTAGAGKLARLGGAYYPAALTRAGAVFAGTLALAAVITATLNAVL